MIFSGALDLPTTLVLVLKETLQCCLRLSPPGRTHMGSQTNAPIKTLFSTSLVLLQRNGVHVHGGERKSID